MIHVGYVVPTIFLPNADSALLYCFCLTAIDMSKSACSSPMAHGGAALGGEGDDEYVEPTQRSISVSEQLYIDSGNRKKVLYLLCIGLGHNGVPLISLEEPPWSSLKKTLISPKNSEIVSEVLRWSSLFQSTPKPRAQKWNRNVCIEWLKQNPLKDPEDLTFLQQSVEKLREVLLNAQQHENNISQYENGGAWRGGVPYLQLIMTLTEDDVKTLFLRRANCKTRQQLDARLSDSR
jgi:hypothetical protein